MSLHRPVVLLNYPRLIAILSLISKLICRLKIAHIESVKKRYVNIAPRLDAVSAFAHAFSFSSQSVQVFRLVTEHTIEEKIVERAQQKLKLDAMVVQSGRLKDRDNKLSRDELLAAVRFGADKIFKSKDSSITDDDIDLILDAGRKKTQELNEKLMAADKGREVMMCESMVMEIVSLNQLLLDHLFRRFTRLQVRRIVRSDF
jgi:hypothetical protein